MQTLLALGLSAPAGASSGSGFVRCPDLTTLGVQVTSVRSNFGCPRARVVLRNLLKGVSTELWIGYLCGCFLGIGNIFLLH